MTAKGIHLAMFYILCLVVVQACARQVPPPVVLRVLESGVHSGSAEPQLQFLVISDPERFAALYPKLHQMVFPTPAVPDIDFTTQRILVAFMGQKPTAGYAIRFGEQVVKRREVIEVTVYKDTPPAGAMVAQMITSPYVMAAVDRGAYTQVRFVDKAGHVLGEIDVN